MIAAARLWSRFPGARALATRAVMLRTRSAAAMWLRLAVAAALAVMLYNVEADIDRWRAPGLVLFRAVISTAYAVLTPAVLLATVGAIGEERAQGTLGLLAMTGLGSSGICFAKGAARLWEILLLLALALPPALAAVALGGVSAGDVVSRFAELGCWLALVASCGIFASVTARGAVTASVTAMPLVAVAGFFCGLVDVLAWGFGIPQPVAMGVTLLAAVALLRFAAGFLVLDREEAPDWLATSFAGLVGAAPEPPAAAAPGVAAKPIPMRLRLPDNGSALPVFDFDPVPPGMQPLVDRFLPARPPAGIAALAWKEASWVRLGAGRTVMALLVVLFLAIAIFSVFLAIGIREFLAGVVGWLFEAGIVLVAGMTAAAAHVVSDELRMNTFEDLRMLPVSTDAILLAKLRGIAIAFAPWCALTALGLVLLCCAMPLPAVPGFLAVVGEMACAVAGAWLACAAVAIARPQLPAFAVVVAVPGALLVGWALATSTFPMLEYAAPARVGIHLVVIVVALAAIRWRVRALAAA